MPEGVNRRWPRTRRLRAARQQRYRHLPEPGGSDTESSAWDGTAGSAPGGLPSPAAADETPQGLSAVGCAEGGRRSLVVDVPVSTSRGISIPVSRQALITAALASVPSSQPKRRIRGRYHNRHSRQAADPRAASGASAPDNSRGSSSARKSLITSAPSVIVCARRAVYARTLMDSGG